MKLLRSMVLVVAAAGLALALAAGCDKGDKGKDGGGGGGGATGPGNAGADDPVWIKVNGRDVHKSDVEREMNVLVKEIGGQVPPEFKDQIKRVGMQRAAQRELLEQVVEQAGTVVEKKELDEAVSAAKAEYPDDVYFQSKLKELGITEEEFLKEIEFNLKFQKYFEQMVPVPEPTEDEIKAFYEEEKQKGQLKQPPKANVIHVFFRFVTGSEDEKKKLREKAEGARKRVEAGEDMSAVAMELSDSPSRSSGGKENFILGQMGGEFDAKVFALKEGELSSIIESTAGLHLVKIISISGERDVELDEVKDQIKEHLQYGKKSQLYPQYMEKLMTEAKIEYLEPLPAEAPVPTGPEGQGLQGGTAGQDASGMEKPETPAGATAPAPGGPAPQPGGTAKTPPEPPKIPGDGGSLKP